MDQVTVLNRLLDELRIVKEAKGSQKEIPTSSLDDILAKLSAKSVKVS